MLAANMATAKILEKNKIPALYRVHPAPEEDKIVALRKFLGEFGLKLPGGKKPTPKDFQQVLVDRQKRRSYTGGEAKFGRHKIGAMSWCLAEVLFQQDRKFIRRSTCTPDCSRKFLLFIL
jgi:hypothetical protein